MQVRVADLPAEGVWIEEELDPLHLPDLVALQGTQGVVFDGPVAVRLHVLPGIGMVHVEGRVAGNAVMDCSRCLTPADVPLDSSFRLTFARSIPGGEDAVADDRELQAQEMGLVRFEGEVIDFRQVVQEQIIMAIPMQVRCRKNCRGLCAGCGVNLNHESCRCTPEDIDPRLSILKKLKGDS